VTVLETTATREGRPLVEAAETLEVLNNWRTTSWPDVAEAAGRAAHLLWDGWSGSGAFQSLPQHDQAAIHHALAVGWRVHSEPLSRLGPDFWQSHVDEFLTEAAYGVDLRGALQDDTGLTTDRARRATEAVYLRQRLRTLPPAWLRTVFERLTPDRWYSWRANPAPALPLLKDVLDHAEAAASGGALPPSSEDRWLVAGERGREVVNRLSRLPDGWQTEAVRRMADGAIPLHAVSDAAQSINIVRAFGVSISWNASSTSPRAKPTPRT
jgi:hypothetical protein